mgnify:CR=1 FL=1
MLNEQLFDPRLYSDHSQNAIISVVAFLRLVSDVQDIDPKFAYWSVKQAEHLQAPQVYDP